MYHNIAIRYIIIILSIISMWGFSYAVFMPVIARDILGGDSKTLGFLMGAVGVGALSSALYLASHRTVSGLVGKIAFCAFSTSVLLVALSLSRHFFLSCVLLSGIGFSVILFLGCCNTILQLIVSEDKRGRVMSVYALSFLGTIPIGSLLLGWISKLISVPGVIGLSGVLCFSGAVYFLFHKKKLESHALPILEHVDKISVMQPGQTSQVDTHVPVIAINGEQTKS